MMVNIFVVVVAVTALCLKTVVFIMMKKMQKELVRIVLCLNSLFSLVNCFVSMISIEFFDFL